MAGYVAGRRLQMLEATAAVSPAAAAAPRRRAVQRSRSWDVVGGSDAVGTQGVTRTPYGASTNGEALVQDVLEAVHDAAAAHQLPVFEGWPLRVPEAEWDGEDLARFIGLGADLDAGLLYATTISAAELAVADDVELADTGFDPDEAVMVVAGWMHAGTLHSLRRVDPRWAPAVETVRTETAVARFRDQVVAHEQDEIVEASARKVVGDPVFWDRGGHGRDDRQMAAVRRILPDLPGDLVWLVVRRAVKIDAAEFLEDRERGWASRARKLMDEGTTKVNAAAALGITVNVLGRVLQVHPPE